MILASAIAEALADDRSKRQVSILVDRMARDGFDLSEFLSIVRSTPLPVKWYLTWTLNHYYSAYPYTTEDQQKALWNFLSETGHEGIQRDLWRIMSHLDLVEEVAGPAFDRAIHIVQSQTHSIAVRAHAMSVMSNVTYRYIELVDEVLMVLSDLDQDTSTGIRTRAKNLIKELKRIKALR